MRRQSRRLRVELTFALTRFLVALALVPFDLARALALEPPALALMRGPLAARATRLTG